MREGFRPNPEMGGDSPEEQLDVRWYERFEQFGSFEAFEYLGGDKDQRAGEKEDFLSGNKENPKLDYPLLDLDVLDSNEAELLNLKKDVLDQETNEVVKKAYRWRINEKLAELRMLKAAAHGDMRRFGRYTDFVYGKPSPEIFQYTIGHLKEQITETSKHDNENLIAAAQELEKVLPSVSVEVEFSQLPTAEEFGETSEAVLAQFKDLITIPIEGERADAEQTKAAFEAAFSKLGLEGTGWEVVVDTESSRTGISVNQENKTVQVPESTDRLVTQLKKLIVHEIGTHVAKREKGERSKLRLLGLGLDRYDPGEEGIATMREQVFSDEITDFSGLAGHLAISLARGVDGEPRDFRQTYDILQKYFYWNSLRLGASNEVAQKNSTTYAWNRAVRTFRGSDSKTPGACFTKDIVYREGNIGVWDVVSKNKDELQRFQVGKYDPANARHIWILESLGITDEELVEMEQ
ncbi:MAG: DUF1704 domain-containing protein [Candidatus Jacksonbacteria bacterium]|jgi:hypothetical protein|nr:DUF1704 domain-containing protein [Candidatus Jacksonbacteria bacterium]MBT6300855.1 DUF1704 domain-containing protein [Candidatus Jacksonbacteria bacterium]MBT6757511.1 DUF1704 domain-containing protein [Candidatus Jacksonbacteria bacterium]MBT6955138.1 DUF1704 domain-containing protein [Candidatus Jacksonbacteria bacterium]MBT7007878.1 DUF1704 domain-containing protein [Candidatus Jacksonbacteria bacterium]